MQTMQTLIHHQLKELMITMWMCMSMIMTINVALQRIRLVHRTQTSMPMPNGMNYNFFPSFFFLLFCFHAIFPIWYSIHLPLPSFLGFQFTIVRINSSFQSFGFLFRWHKGRKRHPINVNAFGITLIVVTIHRYNLMCSATMASFEWIWAKLSIEPAYQHMTLQSNWNHSDMCRKGCDGCNIEMKAETKTQNQTNTNTNKWIIWIIWQLDVRCASAICWLRLFGFVILSK